MYGTLDVGFGTVNNALNSDPNAGSAVLNLPATGSANAKRVTGMMPSNTTASKWGIKGLEDMGGGMKTMFTLESALNLPYGTNPNGRLTDSIGNTSSGTGGIQTNGEGSLQGQMFDREASLGVSGAWGELKAGRMTTVTADMIGAYDPMRVGYSVSPLGFNGGYGGAGFTGEGRWDNSIKYNFTNGPLVASLGYKTAGTTNGLSQGSGLAAAFGYETEQSGVKFAVQKTNDAMSVSNGVGGCTPTATTAASGTAASAATTAACAANGVTSNTFNSQGSPAVAVTFADTSAATLAGRYNIDKTTIKAGYQYIVTKNPANAAYDSASNFPSVTGMPVSYTVTNAFANQRQQKMMWIGANYQASPALELSGALYRLSTNAYGTAYQVANNYGTTTDTSSEKIASVMANYSFTKRTKVYATAMASKVAGPAWWGTSGNAATGTVMPNVRTFSTGIVHSF